MQLYLIRHGQSENNANFEDLHNRVEDPQLTAVGKKQAQHLADFLATAQNREKLVQLPADDPERKSRFTFGFTHIYVSAMHRALQTALPISAAVNIKPEIWIDIHEHGGIWMLEADEIRTSRPGMKRSQIEAEFPDYLIPDTITESGWWWHEGEEDIYQCYARASKVAETLRRRATTMDSAHDVVALVTHGTFLDCLLKAFTERLPTYDYYNFHYNTGVTRLDILHDGKVLIRYTNRVEHLPPELVT